MKLTSEDLCYFANSSFDNGYLKPWKSMSMLLTIQSMTHILEDKARLTKYVKNCLNMEGFNDSACNAIAEFIITDGAGEL